LPVLAHEDRQQHGPRTIWRLHVQCWESRVEDRPQPRHGLCYSAPALHSVPMPQGVIERLSEIAEAQGGTDDRDLRLCSAP
jgi:hypothetical protein